VKPENVLVSADGTVKVVDFGLARAVAAPSTSTQAGMVLGTVAYVSPEQVARGVSDARTDVYSAGVVLFELLTGTPPYGGDSALAVAYRHVNDDVPAPSTRVAGIPPALDELVLRATRREPGGRPADAGVFLAELAMARADLGLRRVPSREVASAFGIEASTVPAGPARTGPTAPAFTGPRGTTALPAYARPVEPPARPRRGASRIGPADGSGWPAERRRRRTWSWVALAVVLLAALSVGTVAWWYGSGRFAAVPSLAQLTRTQAEARLDGADLTARFDQEPSETVAAGRVIRSEPGPGGRVLRGHSVTVVLSSGPPAVPVPSVTGQSVDDAQGAIRSAGLQPHVTEQPSVEVEAGLVISQEPAGGTAKRGSAVRLVVSTGPGIVAVPDVRGLSVDDARQKLEDAGFRVKVRSLRIGNVIAQSPGGGTQREQGTTVTIYGI
jgi:serine/threonine-protein kinase